MQRRFHAGPGHHYMRDAEGIITEFTIKGIAQTCFLEGQIQAYHPSTGKPKALVVFKPRTAPELSIYCRLSLYQLTTATLSSEITCQKLTRPPLAKSGPDYYLNLTKNGSGHFCQVESHLLPVNSGKEAKFYSYLISRTLGWSRIFQLA